MFPEWCRDRRIPCLKKKKKIQETGKASFSDWNRWWDFIFLWNGKVLSFQLILPQVTASATSNTSLTVFWLVHDRTSRPQRETAPTGPCDSFSLCRSCLPVPDASQGAWQPLSLPLLLAIEMGQRLPEPTTPRVMTSVWLGSCYCCQSWAWAPILRCRMPICI